VCSSDLLDPAWARQIIRTLMSVQRSDGWFPRQYSALGRTGKHDLRDYVDAGCFVIELLHDYLCFSKDWSLLQATEPWLDKDDQASIWQHALAAMDYYVRPKNIGEHGLCKIRGGEWLDSLSQAGSLGRGEAVMTTNQAIIALAQMSEILAYLNQRGHKLAADSQRLLKLYARKKKSFRAAIRRHAFNRAGYFSSVFNDGGKWLFSERDPDGARRVYGPANWYSIASGAAGPDLVDSALTAMDALKCADGYRVMHPPMGRKPIAHVGRGGSGDQPAGLWENGTVYNHGSHGFLARALATAGRGDLLYQVLLYLMPYDQTKHPVASVMTPPYAIVN
jgi:cellobiose phosphorylase